MKDVTDCYWFTHDKNVTPTIGDPNSLNKKAKNP